MSSQFDGPNTLSALITPAERLEYVRESTGHQTLKAFREALTGDDTYSVSYEAVRTYHEHRDPPVHYVARVAEVFGVSLEWLILGGEGPVWRKALFEQEFALLRARLLDQNVQLDGGVEGAPGVAPILQTLTPHVRLLFWSTWRRVAEASGRTGLPPEVGQAMSEVLSQPFENMHRRPAMDSSLFSEYVAAMLQAMSLALQVPANTQV